MSHILHQPPAAPRPPQRPSTFALIVGDWFCLFGGGQAEVVSGLDGPFVGSTWPSGASKNTAEGGRVAPG